MESARAAKRPAIFLAVGIGNTLLDFGFYSLLALTIFKDSLVTAGLVSGTVALLIAFTTHSLITWRGRHIKRSTIIKFFAFTGFGMWVIRPVLLVLFSKLDWLYGGVFGIFQSLGLSLSPEFVANTGAFGFMIIIVLIYNYLTYDRFVFKQT